MDELTENLQKLNMIRSKFDQNKDLNKSPIYHSKKQGPGMCLKVVQSIEQALIVCIKILFS